MYCKVGDKVKLTNSAISALLSQSDIDDEELAYYGSIFEVVYILTPTYVCICHPLGNVEHIQSKDLELA